MKILISLTAIIIINIIIIIMIIIIILLLLLSLSFIFHMIYQALHILFHIKGVHIFQKGATFKAVWSNLV